ncbi:signal transducer and activator of transcription 5B-like [Halichondria panicea]|uniref:signal transducer and activator of transcription 5B-like n=1 Tax=Halichondria panicea TaxID=6063 RepID=UPI00312BCA7D
MALWEKSMRLQGPLLEQMKCLYGPRFPIEVRHYLAIWIEQQGWGEIDLENPLHEQEARRLFDSMLQALQDLITTYATNFITKTQLEALYSHMSNEYYQHPLELVRVVQECLLKEQELVDKQDHLNAPSPIGRTPSNQAQIQQYLTSIMAKTEGMETTFREISAKLEKYILQFQEAYQIDAAFQQGNRIPPDQIGRYRQRKAQLDQVLRAGSEEIRRVCTALSQHFAEGIEQIRHCQNLLVNHELANWSQSQRLFSFEDDRGKLELNNMQQWFEALAELLWRNRQLAKQYEMFRQRVPQGILTPDQFTGLTQHLTKQTIDLIQSSFVLEKQPPQVIKTSNRFSAVARLLVGSKLNIHLGQPEVVVSIINDKQAKSLLDSPDKMIPNSFGSGEIMNNSKTMEYNQQNGVVSSSFNFMQLRRIKRNSDKKSNEMVTEEKFTLLFRTQFAVGGGELEINVRTCSLPVVVIVHVTQQPQAEATIFWDDAFAESSREPFQVPVSVSWPQLSEALNCYFHAQTGRGLTPQNLDYLGRKLLGISPEEDLSQKIVTRQQVCKDQMRGRSFTFWEWFYKHLDLVKTTLKREWVEGSIQGFVQKVDAENMLRNCTPGTFLIRFSEGEPGGVSIAWVTEGDLTSSDAQVLSLAPWNKHDLGMRGFADRMHDLTHLLYLFPNEPKDKIFGKYYSPAPIETNARGYIPADLRASIPYHMTQRSGGSNPNSPAPSIVSIGTPLSPPNWPGGPNGGFGSDLGLPVLDFPGSGLGGSFDAGDLMLDVPSVNNTMHQ